MLSRQAKLVVNKKRSKDRPTAIYTAHLVSTAEVDICYADDKEAEEFIVDTLIGNLQRTINKYDGSIEMEK